MVNKVNTYKTKVGDVWDVVVIGGGPSGMMSATTATANGSRVLLLEKNAVLGKKLSITGGGRCNVTNNKPVVGEMLSVYKADGKFLHSTFTQYGVKEAILWFKERGVEFKEENEGRLFPVTESALTIRDALIKELNDTGVVIRLHQDVQEIIYNQETKIFTIKVGKEAIETKACIVAVGGIARPETGSTGEGFGWLEKLGHKVVPNNTALVPLALSTKWSKRLSGLTLPLVKISIFAYNKRQSVHRGRLLFTHFGVTGPLILNMSKAVGDMLEQTEVTLRLDLFPDLDAGAFKEHLKVLLASNKKLTNALADVLPLQLVKELLNEVRIDGETPCHSVSTANRKLLHTFLKAVPLQVSNLLGTDKAVISSGGVVLEEVDFRTMESKIIPGLYIVGDLLNINRPSGGYSLQLCWSTGYVAGLHSA